MYTLLFLIAIIIAFLVYGWKTTKSKSLEFPFQNYRKTDVPYIEFPIQGQNFNVLVDTGCAVSIISKVALEGIRYSESKRKVSLSALTSDSIPSNVVSVPFTLKGENYNEEFVLYDDSDIGGFEVKYGITIHGILSNEFLDKMGAKVDFKRHSVIF